jgi:repressor LexA
MTPPTARQLEIHTWMLAYQRQHGAPPSMRAIGDHFGISSTMGVHDHLVAMAKKGLVRKGPRSWTAIDSTPPAVADAGIPVPPRVATSRPPAASPTDELLRDVIAGDLERIARRFVSKAKKLTLVIRNPSIPGDIIVIGNDDLEAAIEAAAAEIREQQRTGIVTGAAP